jgi:hypothetical protein
VWSRKWALPKFEGFDQAIDWPSGLSFNARYFDRSFLNGLSKAEWIDAARELEQVLVDSAIEKSVEAWPTQIASLHGARIISNLKSRRTQLMESGLDHYKFLAREVDVVGSDKPEWFDVVRKENGDVLISMYKVTKDSERGNILYERLFIQSETREVRMFGLGGNDVVNVSGEESKIKIRFIGGDGEDQLKDTSEDPRRTFFYDDERQRSIVEGKIVNRISRDANVNTYDRKAFKYDRLAPLLFGNFNPDDGVFVGGGFVAVTQGFRKDPFKSRHLFLATIAPLTQSFNFRYDARFTDAVGKWDLGLDFDLKAPNYVNNFFGMGNETIFDREAEEKYDLDNNISYYRFRFEELMVEASLSRKIGSSGTFKIGPVYQRIEIEEPSKHVRYIDEVYAPTLPYNLYETFNAYSGLKAQLSIDKRNDPVFTSRGVVWTVGGKALAGLNHETSSFGSVQSSLSLYHSFRLPARVVFALRVGAGKNFGGYEFYQAQILDGRTELRGFRKTRFYGDEKLFMNIEMRMKVASFRSYLLPASFGILAFHDGGRVWYSEDGVGDPSTLDGKSSAWHSGWGGGVWFTPFNLAVLAIEAGHSEEGTLGYVRLGFLF